MKKLYAILMKNFWCDLFSHKMIQIESNEQACKRCNKREKRLVWMEGFATCYSPWKPASFIDQIAKKGDKVRLTFMRPGTSYWVVLESTVDNIEFEHPATKENIIIKQDHSAYQILN